MSTRRSRRSLVQTLWRTGVLCRCPECGRTSIFRGWIEMHDRCESCNLRYQTSSGAWVGALAIGYGYGAIAAILLASVELAYRPIRDMGLDPLWVIVVVALVVTGVGYRWAKSVWFTLLYNWDFMAFGDDPPGPPPTNPGRGFPPVEPRVRR